MRAAIDAIRAKNPGIKNREIVRLLRKSDAGINATISSAVKPLLFQGERNSSAVRVNADTLYDSLILNFSSVNKGLDALYDESALRIEPTFASFGRRPKLEKTPIPAKAEEAKTEKPIQELKVSALKTQRRAMLRARGLGRSLTPVEMRAAIDALKAHDPDLTALYLGKLLKRSNADVNEALSSAVRPLLTGAEQNDPSIRIDVDTLYDSLILNYGSVVAGVKELYGSDSIWFPPKEARAVEPPKTVNSTKPREEHFLPKRARGRVRGLGEPLTLSEMRAAIDALRVQYPGLNDVGIARLLKRNNASVDVTISSAIRPMLSEMERSNPSVQINADTLWDSMVVTYNTFPRALRALYHEDAPILEAQAARASRSPRADPAKIEKKLAESRARKAQARAEAKAEKARARSEARMQKARIKAEAKARKKEDKAREMRAKAQKVSIQAANEPVDVPGHEQQKARPSVSAAEQALAQRKIWLRKTITYLITSSKGFNPNYGNLFERAGDPVGRELISFINRHYNGNLYQAFVDARIDPRPVLERGSDEFSKPYRISDLFEGLRRLGNRELRPKWPALNIERAMAREAPPSQGDLIQAVVFFMVRGQATDSTSLAQLCSEKLGRRIDASMVLTQLRALVRNRTLLDDLKVPGPRKDTEFIDDEQ